MLKHANVVELIEICRSKRKSDISCYGKDILFLYSNSQQVPTTRIREVFGWFWNFVSMTWQGF